MDLGCLRENRLRTLGQENELAVRDVQIFAGVDRTFRRHCHGGHDWHSTMSGLLSCTIVEFRLVLSSEVLVDHPPTALVGTFGYHNIQVGCTHV